MSTERLSNKLVADYTTLANEMLNEIKITSYAEFHITCIALRALLNDNKKNTCSKNDYIKNKFISFKELLNHPEYFVEKKEHFAQFKAIIKVQIEAKLNQLSSLSKQQKEEYLLKCNQQIELREKNKSEMAKVQAPKIDEERHTLSEIESFIELLDQGYINDLYLNDKNYFIILLIYIFDSNYTRTHLQQICKVLELIKNDRDIFISEVDCLYINGILDIELFRQISPIVRKIRPLIKGGVSLRHIVNCLRRQGGISLISNYISQIFELLSNGKTTFEKIVSLSQEDLQILLKFPSITNKILSFGCEIEEIAKAIHNNEKMLIPLSMYLTLGVKIDQFFNLSPEEIKIVIDIGSVPIYKKFSECNCNFKDYLRIRCVDSNVKFAENALTFLKCGNLVEEYLSFVSFAKSYTSNTLEYQFDFDQPL